MHTSLFNISINITLIILINQQLLEIMGNQQPKKLGKASKPQIDVGALKAKIHLELMRDRKNAQIIKGEKELVQKLKAKSRNKTEQILIAQRVVNGLKYSQACSMLSAYAVSLRAQAQFLSDNLNNPGKLQPWMMQVHSLLYAADRLGLSSLNQFKAVMKAMNDPTGIMILTSPEIVQLLSPQPSAEELNVYMLEMAERNGFTLEEINMVGHKFTKNPQGIPSVPSSEFSQKPSVMSFEDIEKRMAEEIKKNMGLQPNIPNQQPINPNMNPNFNPDFNPNQNQSFNPNQNQSFNPNQNPNFNPNQTPSFNPIESKSFNPKQSSSFNPNPNQNPNYIPNPNPSSNQPQPDYLNPKNQPGFVNPSLNPNYPPTNQPQYIPPGSFPGQSESSNPYGIRETYIEDPKELKKGGRVVLPSDPQQVPSKNESRISINNIQDIEFYPQIDFDKPVGPIKPIDPTKIAVKPTQQPVKPPVQPSQPIQPVPVDPNMMDPNYYEAFCQVIKKTV